MVLRYAQTQSIKSGEEYGVGFSVTDNRFQLEYKGTATLEKLKHPIDKKPYQIDFDETGYYQGITLTNVSLDGGDEIFFDRRGTPTAGGSVTIAFAGQQRTIQVSRPTGLVTSN